MNNKIEIETRELPQVAEEYAKRLSRKVVMFLIDEKTQWELIELVRTVFPKLEVYEGKNVVMMREA